MNTPRENVDTDRPSEPNSTRNQIGPHTSTNHEEAPKKRAQKAAPNGTSSALISEEKLENGDLEPSGIYCHPTSRFVQEAESPTSLPGTASTAPTSTTSPVATPVPATITRTRGTKVDQRVLPDRPSTSHDDRKRRVSNTHISFEGHSVLYQGRLYDFIKKNCLSGCNQTRLCKAFLTELDMDENDQSLHEVVDRMIHHMTRKHHVWQLWKDRDGNVYLNDDPGPLFDDFKQQGMTVQERRDALARASPEIEPPPMLRTPVPTPVGSYALSSTPIVVNARPVDDGPRVSACLMKRETWYTV